RARRGLPGRPRPRRLGRNGRPASRLAVRARVRAAPGRRRARRPARALEAIRGDGTLDRGRILTARPLARDLADEVVALRGAALPAEVLGRAAALLLDFLGVAVGGAAEESSVALRRGLGHLALRGDFVVLGTNERLPAPQAALANGAAAHALEMDDTHQGGSIHLGAAV